MYPAFYACSIHSKFELSLSGHKRDVTKNILIASKIHNLYQSLIAMLSIIGELNLECMCVHNQ